jgi:hypothetical protein
VLVGEHDRLIHASRARGLVRFGNFTVDQLRRRARPSPRRDRWSASRETVPSSRLFGLDLLALLPFGERARAVRRSLEDRALTCPVLSPPTCWRASSAGTRDFGELLGRLALVLLEERREVAAVSSSGVGVFGCRRQLLRRRAWALPSPFGCGLGFFGFVFRRGDRLFDGAFAFLFGRRNGVASSARLPLRA